MIFSAEQPHTGMNEGACFLCRCVIIKKVLVGTGEEGTGKCKKKCQEVILTFFVYDFLIIPRYGR